MRSTGSGFRLELRGICFNVSMKRSSKDRSERTRRKCHKPLRYRLMRTAGPQGLDREDGARHSEQVVRDHGYGFGNRHG